MNPCDCNICMQGGMGCDFGVQGLYVPHGGDVKVESLEDALKVIERNPFNIALGDWQVLDLYYTIPKFDKIPLQPSVTECYDEIMQTPKK